MSAEGLDPAVRIVEYDAGWPAKASEELYLFLGKPPSRPRSHHLHVCEADGEHEFRHIAVRDFLRARGDEAARYAAVKRDAAARHPQDRLAYMAAKDEYVAALEARAVRWARGYGARRAPAQSSARSRIR